MAERTTGKIGTALHVVDARTKSAIPLDLERQPRDKSHRMHRIVVAQHQDARRVLAPGGAHREVVAAAVASGHAFDRCRQVGVFRRDRGDRRAC